MNPDILVGLAILATILLGAYIITHHEKPKTAAGKDLAQTLASSADATWEAVKRDLPQIVSAEVAQLRTDKAALIASVADLETKLAAEVQASAARLAAVQAQVGSVIAGITGQPVSALVAPAVAAAQAEDVAAVKAVTASLSPAS